MVSGEGDVRLHEGEERWSREEERDGGESGEVDDDDEW